MSRMVQLHGGPRDGECLTLPDDRMSLRVPIPPPLPLLCVEDIVPTDLHIGRYEFQGMWTPSVDFNAVWMVFEWMGEE